MTAALTQTIAMVVKRWTRGSSGEPDTVSHLLQIASPIATTRMTSSARTTETAREPARPTSGGE
jgi:hypothetical protein